MSIEDQARWIRFAADAQRLNVEDRFLGGGDRRAHFQHVRAEHQIVTIVEVVGVILHKGGALGLLHSAGHDLHDAHHGGRLPVAFPAESVAFFHQPLDGQAGKLLQLS